EFLAETARDAIALLANFAEISGVASGFRRTGYLFVHGPDDQAEVAEAVSRLSALGIRLETLKPEELTDLYAGIDPDGAGVAVWEPESGPADPTATTQGLLGMARARGLET